MPASDSTGQSFGGIKYGKLIDDGFAAGYADAQGWAFSETQGALRWTSSKAEVKAWAAAHACYTQYQMVHGPLNLFVLFIALASGCATAHSKPAKPATCPCKAHGEPGFGELDEPALMAKARAQLAGAPAAALAKLSEGERRFGDSDAAEERRALAIRALINMGEIGAARSRAYEFLGRYPNGPYSADVASMTGVHPVQLGPREQKP